MKTTLKGSLTRLFCVLFLIVIIIWSFFYMIVSHYIYNEAERQLLAATNQITTDLNREFSALEKLSYQLSRQAALNDFMLATDIESRFHSAAEVESILRGNYNPNFVSDVLAIDQSGTFYRFAGDLSNASCAYLARQVRTITLPNRISMDALGESHLGYVIGVYGSDQRLNGYLLVMTDEEKLHEAMYSDAFDGFMAVGIATAGELITSSSDVLSEQFAAFVENPQGVQTIVRKQMGLTPFEAVAALDTEYLRASTLYFSIAAIVTLIAFALVLILFVRALQRLFVKPMLGLMENAKQIGEGMALDRLKRTGQSEFDRLVDRINDMISSLEENSRTLFEMQYKMQSAELEKQRAIIVSLKKQINAHFMVNTLNVIKRLNETGQSEKAGEMCNGLSSLLRYANGAGDFIGGLEEMRVLEQYVDIMRIRYPERFTVEFDMDDELDDVMLPRMLVQPIIENAIVHGLLPLQKGKLHVSAEVNKGCLIFRVHNDGKGIPGEELEALREKIRTAPNHPWNENGIEHIALPNIQKRVVSMFGGDYGLTIESTAGQGTEVTLTLPAYPDAGTAL